MRLQQFRSSTGQFLYSRSTVTMNTDAGIHTGGSRPAINSEILKSKLTVSFARGGTVTGAEASLHFALSELQLMGVGQLSSAGVTEPLLLPRPGLCDVHRHPRSPRSVPSHLRTRLQVAGSVLLWGAHDQHRAGTAVSTLISQHNELNGNIPTWSSSNALAVLFTAIKTSTVLEAKCHVITGLINMHDRKISC